MYPRLKAARHTRGGQRPGRGRCRRIELGTGTEARLEQKQTAHGGRDRPRAQEQQITGRLLTIPQLRRPRIEDKLLEVIERGRFFQWDEGRLLSLDLGHVSFDWMRSAAIPA